eukprot:3748148-Prymnesium_polylepis.1
MLSKQFALLQLMRRTQATRRVYDHQAHRSWRPQAIGTHPAAERGGHGARWGNAMSLAAMMEGRARARRQARPAAQGAGGPRSHTTPGACHDTSRHLSER